MRLVVLHFTYSSIWLLLLVRSTAKHNTIKSKLSRCLECAQASISKIHAKWERDKHSRLLPNWKPAWKAEKNGLASSCHDRKTICHEPKMLWLPSLRHWWSLKGSWSQNSKTRLCLKWGLTVKMLPHFQVKAKLPKLSENRMKTWSQDWRAWRRTNNTREIKQLQLCFSGSFDCVSWREISFPDRSLLACGGWAENSGVWRDQILTWACLFFSEPCWWLL